NSPRGPHYAGCAERIRDRRNLRKIRDQSADPLRAELHHELRHLQEPRRSLGGASWLRGYILFEDRNGCRPDRRANSRREGGNARRATRVRRDGRTAASDWSRRYRLDSEGHGAPYGSGRGKARLPVDEDLGGMTDRSGGVMGRLLTMRAGLSVLL